VAKRIDSWPQKSRATLRIVLHRGFGEVPIETWDALVARCPDSTIFQTYGWHHAWLRTVGKDLADVRIFAAYRGSELIGLAPLWHGTHRNADAKRPTTYFLGLWHSDYLTFPAAPEEPDVIPALLDALDAHLPAHTPIEFSEVSQRTRLARSLAQRALRRFSDVFVESRTACPRLAIRGNEDVVLRMLRKESLRRHEKKLRQLGEVTVEHLTQASEIEPLLDVFFEQHVKRWSGTPFPSLFRLDYNREFYRELTRNLAPRGGVIFSVLRLNRRPVAHHLGLCSRDDFLWYKPSFDTALAECSPGEVLLKNLISHAQEMGFASLDFTRGAEAFKSRFSSQVDYNQSTRWVRGSFNRMVTRLERSLRSAARRVRARVRAASSG
jgi:CelD/BcsL family acetyltransferase involved in cellulose biosynthesis